MDVINFDTATMTEIRAWLPGYVEHMTEMARGDRKLAMAILRETWVEDAKHAAFAPERNGDNRTTYLPMLLTALDELEA